MKLKVKNNKGEGVEQVHGQVKQYYTKSKEKEKE